MLWEVKAAESRHNFWHITILRKFHLLVPSIIYSDIDIE